MIAVDILIAFAIALIFYALFRAFGGHRYLGGGRRTAALLFLAFFLMVWAGGIWISPFGPTFFGAPWLPFLIVALFIALLVAAMLPLHGRGTPREALERAEAREVAVSTVGAFVWALFVCLVVAIVIHYVSIGMHVAP